MASRSSANFLPEEGVTRVLCQKRVPKPLNPKPLNPKPVLRKRALSEESFARVGGGGHSAQNVCSALRRLDASLQGWEVSNFSGYTHIGSILVPFCGLYLGFYEVVPE